VACSMLRNNKEFKSHYESVDGMKIFGTPILEFTKRELAAFIGWQDEQRQIADGIKFREELLAFTGGLNDRP